MKTIPIGDLKEILSLFTTTDRPISQGRSASYWPIKSRKDQEIELKRSRNGQAWVSVGEGEIVNTSNKTTAVDYVTLISGCFLEEKELNQRRAVRLGLALSALLNGCKDEVLSKSILEDLEMLGPETTVSREIRVLCGG